MRRLLPPAAAVAIAGAATMALEILLPRRLAPDLGTALPVWTADFAVVLLGLAFGSTLGRRLDEDAHAGRHEAVRWLVAAIAIALAPWLARAGASAAAGLPLTARSLVSMAAGGLVPCVALGSIYPIAAARALRGVGERGPALGRLSAAGAIGSLGGTWLTSYAVIPHVDVPTAFYAIAALVALAGVARAGRDRTREPSRSGTASPWIPGPHVPANDRESSRAHAAGLASPPGPAPAASAAAVLPLAALVGALTLALEVVAARRAAVNAGSSLEAWTAVISVVLIGLALGAAIGGWWSKRSEPRRAAGIALVLSAALAAASPWTASAIHAAFALPVSFPARVAAGVFAAYGPLFIALGTIPPILARAAVHGAEDAGRRAGFVYAAGTIGALLGSLLVGPLALPALRLEGAALAAALALGLAALRVSPRRRLALVASLAAVALLGLSRVDAPFVRELGVSIGVRPDADGVWVRDSAYARVVVDDIPRGDPRDPFVPPYFPYGRPARRLKIDARVHGVHDPKDSTWVGSRYGGLYAAAAERVAGGKTTLRALFLGGGTYTSPRAILRRWPEAHVDVAEIDPDVTRAAREEMGLVDLPGLSIAHEDGRAFVRSQPAGPDAHGAPGYDLLFADAFGDVGVPWHLATVEFARECKARMTADGVYLANTIDVLDSGLFVAAMRATLREVYAHVEVIGVERLTNHPLNFVFVASDAPLHLDEMRRVNPADPEGLGLSIHVFDHADFDAVERRARVRPLTDDYAPVERLLAPVVEASPPK